MALFKNWQHVYGGDNLTYDYQLIWYVQRCPANILSAKHMWQDVRNLKRTGSNCVNSCQVQRLFFPTGLPMITMAETLWDRDADFNNIANKYFGEAFGVDGAKLYKLLEKLDDPEIIKGICGYGSREWHKTAGPETCKIINEAYGVIEEIKILISDNVKNLSHPDAIMQSWKYLEYYPEFATLYMNLIMSSFGENNLEKTIENCKKLCDYVSENEVHLHRIIDGFTFRLRLTEDFSDKKALVDVHK